MRLDPGWKDQTEKLRESKEREGNNKHTYKYQAMPFEEP